MPILKNGIQNYVTVHTVLVYVYVLYIHMWCNMKKGSKITCRKKIKRLFFYAFIVHWHVSHKSIFDLWSY